MFHRLSVISCIVYYCTAIDIVGGRIAKFSRRLIVRMPRDRWNARLSLGECCGDLIWTANRARGRDRSNVITENGRFPRSMGGTRAPIATITSSRYICKSRMYEHRKTASSIVDLRQLATTWRRIHDTHLLEWWRWVDFAYLWEIWWRRNAYSEGNNISLPKVLLFFYRKFFT